jgi:hypothetical protein
VPSWISTISFADPLGDELGYDFCYTNINLDDAEISYAQIASYAHAWLHVIL